MSSLVQTVQANLRRRKLLRRGQSALVAVSGGVDSMVLLHVLWRLSATERWKLVVVHFNHRLRGAHSDADEQLVRKTAAQFGLEVVAGSWDDPQRAARMKALGLEGAARQARYGFLHQLAHTMAVPAVATAHHADDQVELFFLRLLRGAGGEGLGGMKWISALPYGLLDEEGGATVTGRHIPVRPSRPTQHDRQDERAEVKLVRPFLDQTKAALRAYAQAEGIDFREDASNARTEADRNWVRQALLPRLHERFGLSLNRNVLRAMEIIAADADASRQAAQRWLARTQRGEFDRLHAAVQRQALKLQLEQMGCEPTFALVERLRASRDEPITVNPVSAICRDAAGRLHRKNLDKARFNPNAQSLDLSSRNGEQVFDGLKLVWGITLCGQGAPVPERRRGMEYFDADKVGSTVRLRHWRPGDRFQPIGMERPVKLQDLFTNLKIPRERRRELVIAETVPAGALFWVEGLRISQGFKLDKQSRLRLKWQWHRD